MNFSILHLSDLHRDLSDEINNKWLLDSLANDFNQFDKHIPRITRPSVSIVTGDLVYGIKAGSSDASRELTRQYAQAEEFLIGLADRFFDGNRERIIILPGNHDVCYDDVMASVHRVGIPLEPEKKALIVADFFNPNSLLRWSWSELCFYKINDADRYGKRLHHFSTTYQSFYQGQRAYSLLPEQQYGVFDFPELGFCVVALNSCFNNDPLRRPGAFHPTALTEACRNVRRSSRAGWLTAAAWHHNIAGTPMLDDYLYHFQIRMTLRCTGRT